MGRKAATSCMMRSGGLSTFGASPRLGLNASLRGYAEQAGGSLLAFWHGSAGLLPTRAAPTTIVPVRSSRRDPRIDVFRGLSLLMIFIDHIPQNVLGVTTLHNFSFSDAAEVFVLLAGFSSMLAYGGSIERNGWRNGVRRIALRCGRIYVAQILLLAVTLGIVQLWAGYFHLRSTPVDPILRSPGRELIDGLTLLVQPSYLNILPLYIVLLGAFPLLYWAMRRSPWLALAGSAAIWLFAGMDHGLNLPNWTDVKVGWYFNPFAWQFLFTIGAVLPRLVGRDGDLPFMRWLAWVSGAYLFVAFLESTPWTLWGLPNLQLFDIGPLDKTHLAWPRILDILALSYLVLSSKRMRALASNHWLRPLEVCGRHSLEVFSVGCILALLARLAFRTAGMGLEMQVSINVIGLGVMCLTGFWLERGRNAKSAVPPRPTLAGAPQGRHWGMTA